jgi:hypothetical protein
MGTNLRYEFKLTSKLAQVAEKSQGQKQHENDMEE